MRLGKPAGKRQVIVYVPITPALLDAIIGATPRTNIGLALVAGGRAIAWSSGAGGPVSGLQPGVAGSANVAGTGVRARSSTSRTSGGPPVYLAATYPSSTLSDAIDSQRLRILVPLLLLA